MTRVVDCTTASHACLKRVVEDLPGGNNGVWVVMAKQSLRLLAAACFQPKFGASRPAKASGFEGLAMKKYSLHRWASILQVIEEEASKNPMLSP